MCGGRLEGGVVVEMECMGVRLGDGDGDGDWD